jgi:hypothetical protein
MRVESLVRIAVMILFASTCAYGQTLDVPGVTLKPVEQGVADTDPLSISLRVLRPDPRYSTNFERLYEARLDPRIYGPELANQRYYVRFAGGVAAVFPQSEYVMFKGTKYAKIPPGTVYSIGGPLAQLMGAPRFADKSEPARVNASQYASLDARKTIDRRAASTKVNNAAQPTRQQTQRERSITPVRSIFSDDEYRKSRLDALLKTS